MILITFGLNLLNDPLDRSTQNSLNLIMRFLGFFFEKFPLVLNELLCYEIAYFYAMLS